MLSLPLTSIRSLKSFHSISPFRSKSGIFLFLENKKAMTRHTEECREGVFPFALQELFWVCSFRMHICHFQDQNSKYFLNGQFQRAELPIESYVTQRKNKLDYDVVLKLNNMNGEVFWVVLVIQASRCFYTLALKRLR